MKTVWLFQLYHIQFQIFLLSQIWSCFLCSLVPTLHLSSWLTLLPLLKTETKYAGPCQDRLSSLLYPHCLVAQSVACHLKEYLSLRIIGRIYFSTYVWKPVYLNDTILTSLSLPLITLQKLLFISNAEPGAGNIYNKLPALLNRISYYPSRKQFYTNLVYFIRPTPSHSFCCIKQSHSAVFAFPSVSKTIITMIIILLCWCHSINDRFHIS